MTIWETGLSYANRFFEGFQWLVSSIVSCECISALFRQHVPPGAPVANPPPISNVNVVQTPEKGADPQPPPLVVAEKVDDIAAPVIQPLPPQNNNPPPVIQPLPHQNPPPAIQPLPPQNNIQPFSLDPFPKPDHFEQELDALKVWSGKNKAAWDNICKVFVEDQTAGKLEPVKFAGIVNGKTKLQSALYTIFSLLQTDAERLFEDHLKAWVNKNRTAWYLAFNDFSKEIRKLPSDLEPRQYQSRLRAAQSQCVNELKLGRLNPLHFIPDRLIILELTALLQASNNELEMRDMVAAWKKDGALCEKAQEGVRFFFPLFRNDERGVIAAEFINQCKQEGIEASLQDDFVENRNGTIVRVNKDLQEIDKANLYQVVFIPPHKTGSDPNGKLNYGDLKKLVNKNRASISKIERHFEKAFTVGDESWSIKIQQVSPFKFKIVIPEEHKNSVKVKYMIFSMFKELKINSHFFKDGKYVFDDSLITKFDDFLTFSRINHKDQSLVLEVIEQCFSIKDDFEERVASIAQIFGADVTIAYGSKPLTDFIPLNTPEGEYLSRFQITPHLANQIKDEGGSIALPCAFQVQTQDDRVMVFLEVLYALTGVRAWNGQEKIFITETRKRGSTHCSNIDSNQMSQLAPVLDKILYAAGDDFALPNATTVEQTINETFKALGKRLGGKVKEKLKSSFQDEIDNDLQAILDQFDRATTFKEVDVIKFNFLAKLVRTRYSIAKDFWKSKSDEKQEENRRGLGTLELAQNEEILGKVLYFLGKKQEIRATIKNWFKDSFQKLLPGLNQLERAEDAEKEISNFLTAQVRSKYGISMDGQDLLAKRKEYVKKRAAQIFLKFEETLFYKRANAAEFRASYDNLKSTINRGIDQADKSESYWGLPPVISGLDYIETFVSNADQLPPATLSMIEQNFIASIDAWAGCQGGIQTKLVFLSTLSDGGQGIAEFTKQVGKNLQETFFLIKRKIAHYGGTWYLEPDGAHGQKAIEVMAAEELGFQKGHIASEDANCFLRKETKSELVAFVKCGLQPLESLVIPELKRNLLDIQEAKIKKQDPSATLMLLGVPAAIEDNPYYDVINCRWNYEMIEQELPLLVISSLIKQKLLEPKYPDNGDTEIFKGFLKIYEENHPAEFAKRTQRQEPIKVPQIVGQIIPFKQTAERNPVPDYPKMANGSVTPDRQYFSVDQEGKLLSSPLLGERADEKILLPLNY